jgi:hypothetical protein
MKPNPLVVLNHFTVPVGIFPCLLFCFATGEQQQWLDGASQPFSRYFTYATPDDERMIAWH